MSSQIEINKGRRHSGGSLREITYREAIREALAEEMRRDPSVFVIGEDVGAFGGAMSVTKGLYDEFGPERLVDTPISESVIVGSAIGAALTGLRPVAEIMFIDFIGVCFDQVINQLAKIRYMLGGQVKVPVTIRTQGGAGKSYAAQHSQSLEAYLMHTPGLKVVMPSTPADAKGLLKSAIRDDNPVFFIEHKLLYNEKGPVRAAEYLIPIGLPEVKRAGKDVTIVAYSRQLLFALRAAEELEREGVECDVIDLRTLVPLNLALVEESVKKTGRLITCEEGPLTGGVGAEISARIARDLFGYLDAPVERVAALDTPIPFARNLEKGVVPQPAQIVEAVKRVIS